MFITWHRVNVTLIMHSSSQYAIPQKRPYKSVGAAGARTYPQRELIGLVPVFRRRKKPSSEQPLFTSTEPHRSRVYDYSERPAYFSPRFA
jgi:hypothetical protein